MTASSSVGVALLLAVAAFVAVAGVPIDKVPQPAANPLPPPASAAPAGVDEAVSATVAEHDVRHYVRWAEFVQRTASLIQQEAVTKATTASTAAAGDKSVLQAVATSKTGAGAGAGAGVGGDPDADDRVEGRPILNQPHIVNHDQLEYQPTTVGQAKPWDWHPGLEGFRPTGGYFMQDPGCDRLMRLWFDTCAFSDASDSVYHKIPDKIFPIGAVDDQVSTGKYIGNLLKQDFESEPRSHSAKQNVGHYPSGEKELVPDDGTDEDNQFIPAPEE